MRDFVMVVVAAGLCGSLIAWTVVPMITESLGDRQIGPIKIEVETQAYSRDQWMLGLGIASCVAAAVAFGLTHGLGSVGRRKRR